MELSKILCQENVTDLHLHLALSYAANLALTPFPAEPIQSNEKFLDVYSASTGQMCLENLIKIMGER
jgi:hypothetical protein